MAKITSFLTIMLYIFFAFNVAAMEAKSFDQADELAGEILYKGCHQKTEKIVR